MKAAQLIEQLDQNRRKVDFDTYDISVQQLVTMVENGDIDVAPAYQRQFRWSPTQRSHLIESLLLGVPVPSLFMATNRDSTWELVDGVQRLSTLVQFAGSEAARQKLNLGAALVLTGLEKLTHFNNLAFDKFPDSLKLHLRNRPLKVITLSDKSDPVVRFDLFERLNTGGVALSNQEIRACIYRGSFNAFIERLAKSKDFQATVKLSDRQEKDGTREECVLRFFAYLNNYASFEHSVVEFLNDYMVRAEKDFDYDKGEQLFKQTFSALKKALPSGIVRATTRSKTPINLFEAVSVGAAIAIKKKGRIETKNIENWISSSELTRLTSVGTNNRKMVAGRIEFCRDKFLGA